MNRLTRLSATVASSAALVAGFAGVAGASPSIGTTGPNSTNRIHRSNVENVRVHNDNDVDATVNNPQSAISGRVGVFGNTTVGGGGGGGGGAVRSGDALNNSLNQVRVSLDNGGGGSAAAVVNAADNNQGGGGGGNLNNATIDTTGPDSLNTITSTNRTNVRVSNDNDVDVTLNNSQQAYSGSVDVAHNTTVGSVSSGDATNVSTNTVQVRVDN